MHSSLPQRQDHLRVRYRALLEDAWGRGEASDVPTPRSAAEPAAPAKGALRADPVPRAAAQT